MASVTSRGALVLAAASMLFSLTLVNAPSASADVLISVPKSQVCAGNPFRVGVWYQSYSGGPRGYRIDVYGPLGKRIFHTEGKATTQWRYWRIFTNRAGRYTTVYHGSSNNGPWVARKYTRAVRC